MASPLDAKSYKVIIIETVSSHKTREAATRALRKLPSRERGLAVVIELPVAMSLGDTTSPKKTAPVTSRQRKTK